MEVPTHNTSFKFFPNSNIFQSQAVEEDSVDFNTSNNKENVTPNKKQKLSNITEELPKNVARKLFSDTPHTKFQPPFKNGLDDIKAMKLPQHVLSESEKQIIIPEPPSESLSQMFGSSQFFSTQPMSPSIVSKDISGSRLCGVTADSPFVVPKTPKTQKTPVLLSIQKQLVDNLHNHQQLGTLHHSENVIQSYPNTNSHSASLFTNPEVPRSKSLQCPVNDDKRNSSVAVSTSNEIHLPNCPSILEDNSNVHGGNKSCTQESNHSDFECCSNVNISNAIQKSNQDSNSISEIHCNCIGILDECNPKAPLVHEQILLSSFESHDTPIKFSVKPFQQKDPCPVFEKRTVSQTETNCLETDISDGMDNFVSCNNPLVWEIPVSNSASKIHLNKPKLKKIYDENVLLNTSFNHPSKLVNTISSISPESNSNLSLPNMDRNLFGGSSSVAVCSSVSEHQQQLRYDFIDVPKRSNLSHEICGSPQWRAAANNAFSQPEIKEEMLSPGPSSQRYMYFSFHFKIFALIAKKE